MYEVDVSAKIRPQTEVPHKIIWGMPSSQQLQDAANFSGLTIIIFTCGHKHVLATNQLLHRKLDSLQIRKSAVHCNKMLKHHVLVYSAPPFNDRQEARAYFAAIFDEVARLPYYAPTSTRRGRLNLIDTLL